VSVLADSPAIFRRPRPTLVRAPSPDPPFDDEIAWTSRKVDPPTPTLVPCPPVSAPATAPGRPQPADADAARRLPMEPLPPGDPPPAAPAGAAASMLARAVVEIISGRRPVAQLRPHCTAEVFEALQRRPVVPSAALPRVLHVRVGEPADGVAEACAVFRRADRARAIAFRMETTDGRWRVTELQIG
jgi:hypothetical protein